MLTSRAFCRAFALILPLFIAITTPAFAQTTAIKGLAITGKMVCEGAPLMNAKVVLIKSGKEVQSVVASETGDFSISIPFGDFYQLQFKSDQQHTKVLDVDTHLPDNVKKDGHKFVIEELSLSKRSTGSTAKTFQAGVIEFSKLSGVFVGKPAS